MNRHEFEVEAIRVNDLGVWNEEQTECDGQRQEIKADPQHDRQHGSSGHRGG